MKFAVSYQYYPLGRFQHEQPGKALLKALNAIKLQNETEKQDLRDQLQFDREEIARLNQKLQELETVYESSSWKLTAPLRALRRMMRG